MIITDQDPAMAKAIARTMPTTHHRFCIWHITNKFSEKISALSYKQHYEEFKHWIWNSESPAEFEWGWQQVVERANLSGNEWLNHLFKIRGRWVPVYMKHILHGIPCRHMLAYFTRYQMEDLPNDYILRRWTKSAKAMRVKDDLSMGVNEICDISLLERRFKLFQLASNVIDEAIDSEDRTRYVEEVLTAAQTNLVHMKAASEDVDRSAIRSLSSVCDHISKEINLKEPLQVRAKGYGKRLKGGKEKANKKPRRCNGCGLTGQTHDKRNCPKLINVSA